MSYIWGGSVNTCGVLIHGGGAYIRGGLYSGGGLIFGGLWYVPFFDQAKEHRTIDTCVITEHN